MERTNYRRWFIKSEMRWDWWTVARFFVEDWAWGGYRAFVTFGFLFLEFAKKSSFILKSRKSLKMIEVKFFFLSNHWSSAQHYTSTFPYFQQKKLSFHFNSNFSFIFRKLTWKNVMFRFFFFWISASYFSLQKVKKAKSVSISRLIIKFIDNPRSNLDAIPTKTNSNLMRDFFHKAPFRVNLIEAWNFLRCFEKKMHRGLQFTIYRKIMRLLARKQAHKIKWTIQ